LRKPGWRRSLVDLPELCVCDDPAIVAPSQTITAGAPIENEPARIGCDEDFHESSPRRSGASAITSSGGSVVSGRSPPFLCCRLRLKLERVQRNNLLQTMRMR